MNIVFSGPKAIILPGLVTNYLTDRITGVVETWLVCRWLLKMSTQNFPFWYPCWSWEQLATADSISKVWRDISICWSKHGASLVQLFRQLSKHLKGRLGPPVSDVTFFNHGGPFWGPPLVTSRFLIMEVGWGPPLVTSRFLIIEVSWAPPLVTSRFLIMEVGWGPVLVT